MKEVEIHLFCEYEVIKTANGFITGNWSLDKKRLINAFYGTTQDVGSLFVPPKFLGIQDGMARNIVYVYLHDKWNEKPYLTGRLRDYRIPANDFSEKIKENRHVRKGILHENITGENKNRVQLICENSERPTKHENITGTHCAVRWFEDKK